MHMNTKKLTGIAACVALMAVCSWISIPFAIPFTMQTFAVFVTIGLLGGRSARPHALLGGFPGAA